MFDFLGDSDADFLPLFTVDQDAENDDNEFQLMADVLPVLALKNTVLFPGVIIPVNIGRDRSIKAIETANESDKHVIVITQRDMKVESPNKEDLYPMGVVARILKVLSMPDGSMTAILQGRKKLLLDELTAHEPFMQGSYSFVEMAKPVDVHQFSAVVSTIKEMAEDH